MSIVEVWHGSAVLSIAARRRPRSALRSVRGLDSRGRRLLGRHRRRTGGHAQEEGRQSLHESPLSATVSSRGSEGQSRRCHSGADIEYAVDDRGFRSVGAPVAGSLSPANLDRHVRDAEVQHQVSTSMSRSLRGPHGDDRARSPANRPDVEVDDAEPAVGFTARAIASITGSGAWRRAGPTRCPSAAATTSGRPARRRPRHRGSIHTAQTAWRHQGDDREDRGHASADVEVGRRRLWSW